MLFCKEKDNKSIFGLWCMSIFHAVLHYLCIVCLGIILDLIVYGFLFVHEVFYYCLCNLFIDCTALFALCRVGKITIKEIGVVSNSYIECWSYEYNYLGCWIVFVYDRLFLSLAT